MFNDECAALRLCADSAQKAIHALMDPAGEMDSGVIAEETQCRADSRVVFAILAQIQNGNVISVYTGNARGLPKAVFLPDRV